MSTTSSDKSTASPLRILLVRPTALGDVSRTVGALASLRRAFPDSHIDWLVAKAFADAVRHHRDLDGVIAFDRKRFGRVAYDPRVTAEVWRWAKMLKQRRYDLVIDLQGLFRSGLFTWMTRAPRRVGFANAREFGRLGYNETHHVETDLHTVDRMMALVAAAGIDPVCDLQLYSGEEHRAWVADYLRDNGAAGEPYAIIAPTARWRCKCWPLDRFADVTARMLDDPATADRVRRAIVLVAPSEREYLQPMIDRFASDQRVLFPMTNVGQLMALIEAAALVLCNDSGALHIAVGFNRPVATIFGPTDPAHVGPYRREDCIVQPADITPTEMRNYRKRRDDQTLIAKVPVEAVWEKVVEEGT